MGKKAFVEEEIRKAPLLVVEEFIPGERQWLPGEKAAAQQPVETAGSAEGETGGKSRSRGNRKTGKKTMLKKIILAEREERRKDHRPIEGMLNPSYPPGVPPGTWTSAAFAPTAMTEVTTATDATNPFSADVPEFVPFAPPAPPLPVDVPEFVPFAPPAPPPPVDVPEFVPFAPPVPTRVMTRQNAGANASKQQKSGAPKPQAGNIFMPSWCRQPAESSYGGAAAASVGHAPILLVGPQDQVAHYDLGHSAQQELPIAQAMQRLRDQSQKRAKGDATGARGRSKSRGGAQGKSAELEVRRYVHQVLSDDLDEKVKYMLGHLAHAQDPANARPNDTKQKRFCVGMRECERAVKRARAIALICAPNLESCSAEGGLDDCVEELIEICTEHEVPVIFALSRNRIGKALGRNVRQSAVAILSAEGVQQEFKAVIKQTEELRKMWVMNRMAASDGPVPVPARLPAGALAHIHVSDVGEDETGGTEEEASTADEAGPRAMSRKRVSGEDDEDRLRELRDKELLEQERLRAEARAAAAEERRAAIRAAVEKRAEEQRREEAEKRAAEREARAEERREAKKRKEAEKAERLKAKQAEQAAAEEEQRLKEEKLQRELKEEEERKEALFAAQRERARIMAEKAKEEAERREAEEEARLEALAEKDSDSDSDDLPAGFNADLF